MQETVQMVHLLIHLAKLGFFWQTEISDRFLMQRVWLLYSFLSVRTPLFQSFIYIEDSSKHFVDILCRTGYNR